MNKTTRMTYPAYLYSMVVLGSAVIALSFYRLLQDNIGNQWMILACLTAFAGPFTVKIPRVNSKISIADTFVFTNLILFGPAAAAITAGVDGFLGSMRSSKGSRLQYTLFNMAAMALSAFVAGEAFFQILGRGALYLGTNLTLREIVLPTGVMALAHYLCNSVGVATIISLDAEKSIYRIWRENFLWASVTYFPSASVAALLALNVTSITPAVLGIIVPVLLVSYFTYKTYLDKAEENQHRQELHKMYLNTVEALARAIDAKDHATHGHARRVQVFARGLARAMGVSDQNELRGVEAAALLHDIGNLAVPEYILNKPGELTRSEAEKMMIHPLVGADILGTINFPYPVAEYVRQHHEHWDGTGYPDKLKGKQISLGARVLAVADTYEALTGERPYQPVYTREQAIEVIRQLAGGRFDPEVVERFESILDNLLLEVEKIEVHELKLKEKIFHPEDGPQQGNRLISRSRDSRVFHDISSAHKEVFALYELAQKLGTTLNLQETLQIIGSKIGKIVPFTTCVIYLYSEAKDSLRAVHVSGADIEAFNDHVLELVDTVSGWVATNGQPAINADPGSDLARLKSRLAAELETSLVYPLTCQNTSLGTIALYGSSRIQFGDDHERVMEIVSKQAATAIHNAIKFEETREDACTDRVTSLPNSRYLYLYFEQELQKAMRFQYPVTVLGMDLDKFKDINDTYGHQVGDRFLVEVAKILKANLRGADVVVRFGGDEFVAVLPQTAGKDASWLAKRMQAAVDDFSLEVYPGKFAHAGISIGMATYPSDGDTLELLLESADRAMYRDKASRSGALRGGQAESVVVSSGETVDTLSN